ncbi:MAG: phosphoribosylformylglycinamidine cyclo-ligase [Actinomycetota bacterium]|nr:phosphoribosylformylglycinamidine cyclo-ligase [Actinomycetota bacterium]
MESPGASDGARPLTYLDAGVDISAGEKTVELIKPLVRATFRPEVLGDIGGFGGLFAVDWKRYDQPVLVSSTDGVGTKSVIARLAGLRSTIGVDLVAMSVDDIAVQGAEPLFFLDYVSIGALVPEEVAEIVAGVSDGCVQAGCALIGGEISEHPDLMAPGEFDLVGFVVGVVERTRILPSGIGAGDRLVGIASPGLRCNGYALARRALLDRGGRSLDDAAWPGSPRTLGEELLLPSVIYSPAMRTLTARLDVHGFAHITGGGLPDNVARVLPDDCDANVRRGAWPEPRIFAEIQSDGDIADAEMEHVFNLGVGMVAVVTAGDVAVAIEALAAAGHEAFEIGQIVDGHGRVSMLSG